MKELTTKALVENIYEVTAFVENELTKSGCPTDVIVQVSIAIDEIFSNICTYAYESDPGQIKIQLDINSNSTSISLSFTDWGKAYNPLLREDPDISLPLEDRQIGGLGLFIVKQTMDDVIYSHDDANKLTLIKKW